MSDETASGRVSKAKETLRSATRSGGLAAASGGVTLLRAVQSFRRGNAKRGGVRLLAAGFWLGVAAVQRRSGGSDDGVTAPFDDDVDQREVADTSPDIGDVATEADEGTGVESPGDPSDVVNTTSADIDEPDTATEHDSEVDADPADAVDTGAPDLDESETDTGLDSDVDAGDVDESDVVDTDTTVDPDVAEEAQEPAGTDNAQVVEEEGETEVDTGRDDDESESDADVEPKSIDDDTESAITERDEDEE